MTRAMDPQNKGTVLGLDSASSIKMGIAGHGKIELTSSGGKVRDPNRPLVDMVTAKSNPEGSHTATIGFFSYNAVEV